jgi:hypothetical protein
VEDNLNRKSQLLEKYQTQIQESLEQVARHLSRWIASLAKIILSQPQNAKVYSDRELAQSESGSRRSHMMAIPRPED